MDKKILLVCISAVLMLVTITYASAINTNDSDTTTNIEKKDSPLYNIRTRLAIGEKISEIFKSIKSKFIGERIFFLPLFLDGKTSLKQLFGDKGIISFGTNCAFNTECAVFTCVGCGCTRCTQCSQIRLESTKTDCPPGC